LTVLVLHSLMGTHATHDGEAHRQRAPRRSRSSKCVRACVQLQHNARPQTPTPRVPVRVHSHLGYRGSLTFKSQSSTGHLQLAQPVRRAFQTTRRRRGGVPFVPALTVRRPRASLRVHRGGVGTVPPRLRAEYLIFLSQPLASRYVGADPSPSARPWSELLTGRLAAAKTDHFPSTTAKNGDRGTRQETTMQGGKFERR